MKFGPCPSPDAAGSILAHATPVGAERWTKGRLLSAGDCLTLQHTGIDSVIVARLDPGDIGEDAAAAALAAQITGPGAEARTAVTGRVNLHARTDGVFRVDTDAVNRLNAVSEAVTLATLPPFTVVEAGQMIATVKIIPFAVPSHTVAACTAAGAGDRTLSVAPWRPRRAGLIQTTVSGTKETVLDKTRTVLSGRLTACGGTLIQERRCAHRQDDVEQALRILAAEGCDLFLMIGASAITDRSDILPSALTGVGGQVAHLGMPVDPGNLLMLGWWADRPVLGLPGCARSPRLNGADWVLQRLAADIPVTGRDLMGMGVGGLIMDVPERPLPRAQASRPPAD